MQPAQFPEVNVTLAKDQPPYRPLPAHRASFTTPGVPVVTCWQLTWCERLRVLVRGRLWLTQLTFGHLFQPIRPEVAPPAELRG